MRALPWTVVPADRLDPGHWSLGNLFGGLAGYFQNNRLLKVFGVARDRAFSRSRTTSSPSSCCIVFGFVWPILPISGAYAMDVEPGWNLEFVLSVIAACDPAGHVADHRRLRHLVPRDAGAGLEHRHRGLRDLRRTCRCAAPTRGLLLRHPQRRGAAADRAGPGARVDLLRHHHHRTGLHLSRPRHAAWSMRSTKATAPRCSPCRPFPSSPSRLRSSSSTCCIRFSIHGSGRPDAPMFAVVRDLFRYNREFTIGVDLDRRSSWSSRA